MSLAQNTLSEAIRHVEKFGMPGQGERLRGALDVLERTGFPPMFIDPLADGGVALQWNSDRETLNIYVDPEGFSSDHNDLSGNNLRHEHRDFQNPDEMLSYLQTVVTKMMGSCGPPSAAKRAQ